MPRHQLNYPKRNNWSPFFTNTWSLTRLFELAKQTILTEAKKFNLRWSETKLYFNHREQLGDESAHHFFSNNSHLNTREDSFTSRPTMMMQNLLCNKWKKRRCLNIEICYFNFSLCSVSPVQCLCGGWFDKIRWLTSFDSCYNFCQ